VIRPGTPYKAYLGDGVYADFDGYAVVLTTENGIDTTNRIVLEPEILRSLTDFWSAIRTRLTGVQP
jgi:hypothetical protein